MLNVIQDAVRHSIWAAPYIDRQFVIEPVKITRFNGNINTTRVLKIKHELPYKGSKFHIFQIGACPTYLLGLFPLQQKWVNVSACCNAMDMHVNIYTDKGIEIPKFKCFYANTADGNLFFAIEDQNEFLDIDLNKDKIYIRVYSNVLYKRFKSTYFPNKYYDIGVATNGIQIDKKNSTEFWKKYDEHKKLESGYLWEWINGNIVTDLTMYFPKEKDRIEFVYDPTVIFTKDYELKNLPTFHSSVFNEYKYLLHNEIKKQIFKDVQLNYYDDVDIYLFCRDEKNKSKAKGYFYYRNTPKAVSQITHSDYSISVEYVNNLIRINNLNNRPVEDFFIRIIVRKGLPDRENIFESNRLHELYKLEDKQIQNLLLGINSNIPFWQASTLEASSFAKLVSQVDCNFDLKETEDTLGYNGIISIVGQNPIEVNDKEYIDIPYIYRTESTAYEYDDTGLLLTFTNIVNREKYYPVNKKTKIVEFINGISDETFDEYYNKGILTLQDNITYRMYISSRNNPKPIYEDVTGSDKYVIKDKVLYWMVKEEDYDTLVVSNKHVLVNKYSLALNESELSVSIARVDLNENGVRVHRDMDYPTAIVDVFLNGYSLIEGIDYTIEFPKIRIFNKRYLLPTMDAKQKILIRSYGLSSGNTYDERGKVKGFIIDRTLSNNKVFDVSEDKVKRIIVGGRLKLKKDLYIPEDNSTIKLNDNIKEGTPYSTQDYYIDTLKVSFSNTEAILSESLKRDGVVSDYMTKVFPPANKEIKPLPIDRRYDIFSPFFYRLFLDLKPIFRVYPGLVGNYGKELIDTIVKSYMYLFVKDPVSDYLKIDDNYVQIQPLPLYQVEMIDIYEYQFLDRVNRYICKNKVQMSHYFSISKID